MTNAQKWVAAFLLLFVILLVAAKLTTFSDNQPAEDYTYTETDNLETNSPAGLSLINKVGCVTCHGQDLKGTKMAPGLYTASKYWNRNDLINYLRQPSSYDGDERFNEYRQKYQSIVMPSYGNIDVKDLGKIADYILSLEE